eukprot:CAMPEP_0194572580 /NCGR_PEP_ID=MMETSP0292-20121207/9099_1 /TAXON_ID=39354 /ORGANISM="Heterosigma akashiwo, Strain CCMP2393" /LENGTH=270 /DNA_ID=CAMNT_0039423579 /DNA_START=11 /DNA_END=823 /DNA_ORIENTATION=-
MAPSTTVVLGGSAALAALSAASYFLFFKKEGKTVTDGVEDVDVIELPDITKAQVLEIFTTINQNMQAKVRELTQQLDQISQQMKAAGQALPEKEIHAYLSQEFESHLKKVEEQVLEKYKTDEDELEEATEYFEEQGDEEVKAVVRQLEVMYEAMSGTAKKKEAPADLTREKFLALLPVYFGSMSKALAGLVEEAARKGITPQSPEMQQLVATQLDARALKTMQEQGLDNEVFNAGLQKFHEDPEVFQKLQEYQMLNQQQMMQMGFMPQMM